MAITTLDGYIGSAKQRIPWIKTATRTTIATFPFSLFELAGKPGAGALAIGNTANGVVPTDAVAGYPVISAFGGSATGYLSKVEYGSTIACWIELFDRVFACGAYAYNANVNLASQPSFVGRLPNSDYKDLQIYVEQVTAATGLQAVNVTYYNETGVGGGSRSTGTVGIGTAPTVGRCWPLPLQAGDAGVSQINNVTGSTATVGTFNVMVLRPLWSGRVMIANGGDVHDLLRTGLVQVYADSALYVLISADAASSGIPEMTLEIANG